MKVQIAISLLFLAPLVYAKGPSGIYMNTSDYKNNKISYGANGNAKIRLHDFFGNSPILTVANNGEKHRLKKEDVYGYCDKKGNVYRFYANEPYKIIETSGIYVYSQERTITQSKGFKVTYDYFFSLAPDGKIFRLTEQNLKAEFSGDEKFLDQLEAYDGDLAAYNSIHKMFAVNYLYAKLQK